MNKIFYTFRNEQRGFDFEPKSEISEWNCCRRLDIQKKASPINHVPDAPIIDPKRYEQYDRKWVFLFFSNRIEPKTCLRTLVNKIQKEKNHKSLGPESTTWYFKHFTKLRPIVNL